MRNDVRQMIGAVCILSLCVGCASAKKTAKQIDVRGYVQDRARVDQEISGKIGNWENAPMAEDPERRMTRKVYYLEVTKEADPEDIDAQFATSEEITTKAITSEAYAESTKPVQQQNRGVVIPKIDYDEPASSPVSGAVSGFQQYKVEKDDTLQKISKKFYNSYSKWPRIYEANKDVITDPNFIKPGITIKVPLE